MSESAIAEIQAPEITQEAPPQENAEGASSIDAAAVELESVLGTASKEDATTSPELSDAEVPAIPETSIEDALGKEALAAAREQALEQARQEAATEFQRQQQQLQQYQEQVQRNTQFRQRYDQRVKSSADRVYKLAIDAGYSEDQAKAEATNAWQDFNSHHADGLQFYQPEALQQARQTILADINAGIGQSLGKDAAKFWGTPENPAQFQKAADLFARYKEIVTEGLMTPAQVEAERKAANVALFRELKKKGLIKESTPSQRLDGTSTDSRTEDQILADEKSDINVVRKILDRRNGVV